MSPRTEKTDTDDDFLIEKFSLLVGAIAKTFGSRCEVVLHDLRQLNRSVVNIEHGHITGRKVGSSITDFGLRHLRESMIDDVLVNYQSTTNDGRTLKSTTVLLKNRKGTPVAALCINIDITNLQQACLEITELCQLSKETEEIRESFENDITDTIASIIENTIKNYPKPIPAMHKDDRITIVAKLDEQGVFLIKGAVKVVAAKLNVSKYAIYNYLEAIKLGMQRAGAKRK